MSGRPSPGIPVPLPIVVRWTHSRILIAGLTAAAVACRGDEPRKAAPRAPATSAANAPATPPATPRGAPPADTTRARRDTFEAGGDVSLDSTVDSTGRRPQEIWMNDANVVALFAAVNARQVAAAQIELQAWQSDTVSAFAGWMLREHTALGRALDSLAARIKLTPIAPALATPVIAPLQAQLDTLRWLRGLPLDRAYIRQQVSAHESMVALVAQLGAVAQNPELDAFLTAAGPRIATQLTRARMMDTLLLAKDSLWIADSVARVDARRIRRAKLARDSAAAAAGVPAPKSP